MELNEVECKCCDENDKVAEAVRMNYSKKQVALLAFRNCVEINGNKYVLTRITNILKVYCLYHFYSK
jgi:hypothetical protein